ncbi:uncharacterized protein LOC106051547 [Biomphalaria glabrata]|uniref:Uncharacterized protein LOC106051547 n=1 Tax=Biomphalaria glabrata TaxID=6526 RepID=A0A9U8DUM5_BIOGL|nr:uncharacterized protein LOC106051547 [Biomphalaria glabrata]
MKMSIQRVLLRLLRFSLPILFVFLLLSGSFIISFVRNKLWAFRLKTPLVPYNELERSHVSRELVLKQFQNDIEIVWAQRERGPKLKDHCLKSKLDVICTDVQYNIDIAQGMGLSIPESNVSISGNITANYKVLPPVSNITKIVSSVNPGYLRKHLCYNVSRTRQLVKRTVDANFCPRLLKLFEDITIKAEPYLLLLFTWWPDYLVDVDKFSRKLLLENCKRVRPFVETIIFTDSRMTMANANAMNFTCLPVPGYSSGGLPIFQNMAKVVMEKFSATFYGYVKATSVFDASFLESLLGVKEILVKSSQNEKSKSNRFPTSKPIAMYGEAMHYQKLSSAADLYELNLLAYTRGSYEWENPQAAFVYFVFTKQDMSDVPPLIIDDDALVPFLIARSRTLGHLVINVGRTVTALYTSHNATRSEWNRKYIKELPRDSLYNKNLAMKYFNSIVMNSSHESHDLYSTFNSDGKIVFKGWA